MSAVFDISLTGVTAASLGFGVEGESNNVRETAGVSNGEKVTEAVSLAQNATHLAASRRFALLRPLSVTKVVPLL